MALSRVISNYSKNIPPKTRKTKALSSFSSKFIKKKGILILQMKIGKNLALTETKVMLIKLVQRFDKIVEHSVKERKIDALLLCISKIARPTW